MTDTVLVGTSKGLVVIKKQSDDWAVDSVQHLGFPVSMIYPDAVEDTWWVGLAHRHWGTKLHYSRNKGDSWESVDTPSFGGRDYRPDRPASLKNIWTMQRVGSGEKSALWLGVEPASIFTGNAESGFHLSEGLWNHETRSDERMWFGAGRNLPYIHSIVVDPRDADRAYVAVSAAGIFETRDAGLSWCVRNSGMVSNFLPDPYAKEGHDPHILLQCRTAPDVLWQQAHSGVFVSENGGMDWKDVSPAGDIPRYGFAMAIDHNDPDCAWIVPATSDEMRIAPDLKLRVYKTSDRGRTWQDQSKGLPDSFTFDIVLRQSFIRNEELMILGTNNGNLYISEDNGENWNTLAQNLPKINVIMFDSG